MSADFSPGFMSPDDRDDRDDDGRVYARVVRSALSSVRLCYTKIITVSTAERETQEMTYIVYGVYIIMAR